MSEEVKVNDKAVERLKKWIEEEANAAAIN